MLGVILLGLTLVAGFVGYALPWDVFSVTATGIGFGLARSIPVIGQLVADLFFGGVFPSLGSLPRLYTIHVVVIPLSILAVLSLHLLLVLKQKHSMPGYAKKLAEPGRVLGISLWPYHALLAGQLVFLMLGGLSLLAAFVPAHRLAGVRISDTRLVLRLRESAAAAFKSACSGHSSWPRLAAPGRAPGQCRRGLRALPRLDRVGSTA